RGSNLFPRRGRGCARGHPRRQIGPPRPKAAPRCERPARERGRVARRHLMRIVRDVPTLRELVAQARMAARPVAFVPTMGALHEGHLSLVRLARREGGLTIASIFVNPLQFAPGEDLSRYPRREKEDAALLEREGAREGGLYRPDFSTVVQVAAVTEGGEGAVRPGHFSGVATVVLKLFLRVLPDVAVFGRKDLQQVAVVRRMIRDLDLPIRLVVG